MCHRRRCKKTSKQVLTDWALLSDIANGVYSRKPVSRQLSLPSRSLAPSVVLFLALLFMVEPFLPFRCCVCHLTHSELMEKEKPAEHPNNNFRKRLSGKFPISCFHINCQLINYLHSRRVTNCSCIACPLNYAAWLGAVLCL